MSRTFKDRPYWVKLNNEGVMDHDHRFSEERAGYRNGKMLRDEKGQPIVQEVEVYRTAEWIAENAPRTKEYYIDVTWPVSMRDSMRYSVANGNLLRRVTGKGNNPIWEKAQALVNKGLGKTELLYQVVKRPQYRKIEVEPARECTAHLPETPWSQDRNEDRPCSRVLPQDSKYRQCSCSMCRPGGIVSENRSRTRTRNALSNMVKAANSGEDAWEDPFEERELYMTKPLRYSSDWC